VSVRRSPYENDRPHAPDRSRHIALRQLCALAKVSNPYLSQVERGLHDPSVRVPKSTGEALNVMSAGA
jgi:transcriptional regulator with XRE-family HTH domain